jgi:hypothetical protein
MVVASRSAWSPNSVDRTLAGVCAVIWLAFIGVAVAATVVLVDKGSRGHHDGGGGSHTPWLLYAVIGVSALIIVGAIPLLLRARRSGQAEPARGPVRPPAAVQRSAAAGPLPPGQEAPTEKLRVFGSIADPIGRDSPVYRVPEPAPRRLAAGLSEATVERLWLRATLVLAGAMGLALLAVATATYLMGVDKDRLAFIAYFLAGAITVAMPVIPWLYLRQLRATVAGRLG